MGCLLLGWLRDFWRIPSYVQQASRSHIYVLLMKSRMRQRPPSSFFRGITMFMFSNYLGALSQAPLGFFEPQLISTTVDSAITHSLSSYPLWWILLTSIFSAMGSTIGVIIVGRIDGQRTANYWYMLLAALFGAFLDIIIVACTNIDNLSFLQYLCPLIIWQRSCEWVPSVFDKQLDKRVIRCGKKKAEITCSMPLVIILWAISSAATYAFMILYVYMYTPVVLDPQAELGFRFVGRIVETPLFDFARQVGIPVDFLTETQVSPDLNSLAKLHPICNDFSKISSAGSQAEYDSLCSVSVGTPLSLSSSPVSFPPPEDSPGVEDENTSGSYTSIPMKNVDMINPNNPTRLRVIYKDVLESRFARSMGHFFSHAKEIILRDGFKSGLRTIWTTSLNALRRYPTNQLNPSSLQNVDSISDETKDQNQNLQQEQEQVQLINLVKSPTNSLENDISSDKDEL